MASHCAWLDWGDLSLVRADLPAFERNGWAIALPIIETLVPFTWGSNRTQHLVLSVFGRECANSCVVRFSICFFWGRDRAGWRKSNPKGDGTEEAGGSAGQSRRETVLIGTLINQSRRVKGTSIGAEQ
jgi:hypothetical protein